MIINIEVKNRVATYRSLGSDPVCGSNNDTVKFHFDAEWNGIGTKTARFVWGDRYFDQEFEGDSCPAPLFVNLTRVYVGVYAGEPVEEEPAWATTKAEVPYRLSVRCGYHPAQPESGNGYTNEAKGYAMEAQAAAEVSMAAAERSEGTIDQLKAEMEKLDGVIQDAYGMTEVGRLSLRLYVEEVMDEAGAYVNVLTFGERTADPANGAVLLSYEGEMVDNYVHHSQKNVVMQLLRCPYARIILERVNPSDVLKYPVIYDGRAGGECWRSVDMPYDGSLCSLRDTSWSEDGVRLVISDNISAPNIHSGPMAVFLQFPEAVRVALNVAQLSANDSSSYLTCTIIGYQ